MGRLATTVLCAVLLSACSASIYKEEVSKLSAAGKTFADAPDNYDTDIAGIGKSSEAAFVRENVFDGLPLDYHLGKGNCSQRAVELGSAIYAQIEAHSAPKGALKDLKTIPRCDINQPSQAAIASRLAAAEKKPQPKARTDRKSRQAARQREKNLRELELDVLRDIAAEPRGSSPHLPLPPAEPITLAQVSKELSLYFTGLQGIVAGETVDDVNKQLAAAIGGAAALAKAAKVKNQVTPATNLFFAVFDAGINQARYSAVRQAVLSLDGVWPKAASDIATALRIRHVLLVVRRAEYCRELAGMTSRILNDEAVLDSGADRLTLYDRLEPDVSAANDRLEAAARTDPADTVEAFTNALHALALAVADPTRQDMTVYDRLKDLTDKAVALDKALQPAAKGT